MEELHMRLGKFQLTHDIIKEAPDVVMRVMGTVIVTRAESLYHANLIEYVAMSPAFDEVPEDEVVPEYDIEYDADTEVVTWVRKT